MMRFSVPQFVNVEDKIVGPLSWKQLYWVIGMTVVLLVLWKSLPFPIFVVLGLFVFAGFMAMAFYKPWGQPLPKVAWFAMVYVFRPKIYTWRRTPRPSPTKKTAKQKPVSTEENLTSEDVSRKIRNYADLLDNPEQHVSQTPLTTTRRRGILKIFSRKNKQ